MRPGPGDTVCDPACGTGRFLLAAHQYLLDHHGKDLDPDQKRHLRRDFARGVELVPNTARLCTMNCYLHGIDADPRRSPRASMRWRPCRRSGSRWS
jgi:type I restriction enzyme M protein